MAHGLQRVLGLLLLLNTCAITLAAPGGYIFKKPEWKLWMSTPGGQGYHMMRYRSGNFKLRLLGGDERVVVMRFWIDLDRAEGTYPSSQITYPVQMELVGGSWTADDIKRANDAEKHKEADQIPRPKGVIYVDPRFIDVSDVVAGMEAVIDKFERRIFPRPPKPANYLESFPQHWAKFQAIYPTFVDRHRNPPQRPAQPAREMPRPERSGPQPFQMPPPEPPKPQGAPGPPKSQSAALKDVNISEHAGLVREEIETGNAIGSTSGYGNIKDTKQPVTPSPQLPPKRDGGGYNYVGEGGGGSTKDVTPSTSGGQQRNTPASPIQLPPPPDRAQPIQLPPPDSAPKARNQPPPPVDRPARRRSAYPKLDSDFPPPSGPTV